jgi:hypothetical protein
MFHLYIPYSLRLKHCVLVFRIPDDGWSPGTWLLVLYTMAWVWEENKISRELKQLVLTAQQNNNLSTVLTEMSAVGLEVSTADQYSQDLKFKTNPLH